MTQRSYFWAGRILDGAPGDAGPYTDDTYSDIQGRHFVIDRTRQGVLLNSTVANLAATNPAGNTIRISSGAAMVDGKDHDSDANEDFVIATPGAGSNFYTIVLSKDFAAQEVRLAALGPDVATFPVVTQTDGTLWEIALWRVQITNAAVITITDQRSFVTTPFAMGLIRRQGDSATDWNNAGTTEYVPTPFIVQCGAVLTVAASPAATITFPIPFSSTPLVVTTSRTLNVFATIANESATGFQVYTRDSNSQADTIARVTWIAIGPRVF